MPSKRRPLQIVMALSISLVLGLAFFVRPVRGALQEPQTSVHLTLLPDYASGQVMAAGMVSSLTPISVEEAALEDWGFGTGLNVWPAGSQDASNTFYLQGPLENASLSEPEEGGPYRVALGPLQIPPGGALAVTVPFASLDLGGVSPPPDNPEEVRDPRLPLTSLRYSAGEGPRELTVQIAFVPIQKEIDLNLFPLIGELLQKRQDSYRLYGGVTFKDIQDFNEFEKYCQSTVEDTFWPYRMADTLFTLDYLPVFHFGYLPPAYQYKPSYLLVRSDLQSCSYEGGVGQVTTTITGRVFNQPEDPSRFPDVLLGQDVPERQDEVLQRGTGTGIYEIQLGSIFLAPGDLLKVTLPGTDLRGISPAPSRFTYNQEGDTLAEFDGPGKFILRVRYAPRPELFVQQLPATIRAFGSGAENLLGSLDSGPGSAGPWALLVVCLAAVAGVQRLRRLRWWPRALVWYLAGVLCYYSFPHVFGLAFFAVGLHLLAAWGGGSREAVLRSALTLMIAIGTLALDIQARGLIYLLDAYHLDLTLFTPCLLILFGLVAFWINRRSWQGSGRSPVDIAGPAVLLFAFGMVDGLQKSLPTVLVAGGLAFVLARRFSALSRDQEPDPLPGIVERFGKVWSAPFLWIGLAALAVFVISNDVTSTAEVLSPTLGVVRFLLGPVLLFLSVALSFLATGGLFLLLYPALPFKEAYLKAIAFAAGLWLLFVLGVGADDRLVIALPSMLAGRFIYYLSPPLLVGIYVQFQSEREAQAAEGAPAKPGKEAGAGFSLDRIFEPLKNLLGPLGSLASLVAPGLYAWFSGQPLVTSYFDVLEVLVQFTLF